MRAYASARRGQKNPAWRGGITPERQAFYKSQEWATASLRVWQRERATCQRCGVVQKNSARAFHVHHVVSFRVRALRADTSNLALLCQSCHMFVHSKRNVAREFIKTEAT